MDLEQIKEVNSLMDGLNNTEMNEDVKEFKALVTSFKIQEPDEFDLAGFNFTEEQKDGLRKLGICIDSLLNILKSFSNEENKYSLKSLDNLMNEDEKIFQYESNLTKEKKKTWKKNKFWE